MFLPGITHASAIWLIAGALGGIRLQVPAKYVAFLAVHLFSIPLPWQTNRSHCQSCGAEWENPKND